MTTESKCNICPGAKCCTYITEALGTIRSKVDFEHLLWQVSHEGIETYKDSDGWFLLINTRCTHLLDDGHCGIYDSRMTICREYENDWCEYDAPAEDNFMLHFRHYEELLKYCKKRFKTWGE